MNEDLVQTLFQRSEALSGHPDALDRYMQETQACTSTVDVAAPKMNLDMLAVQIAEMFRLPRPIGNIGGIAVWVDPEMPDSHIELRYPGQKSVRFSIEHPYIQGTKLEKGARAALGG